MPRTLYSPRLSDDVVRSLYREGKRRDMPMTRLADLLLREALGATGSMLAVLPDPRPSDHSGKAVA
jgi:hypothetical protein